MKIVEAVDNDLEVCFDTNHLMQETPEEFVVVVKDLITTVHVSDYDGEERHWLPGPGGIINWNSVIAELTAIGFEGPWMYEVLRDGGHGRDENYTAKDLTENWKQLKSDYLNYSKKGY